MVVGVIWAFSVAPPEKEIPITNHFHLALWPYSDGDLGRWTQWLLTAHVRRYHRFHRSSGHIWQGRFKAFPIEMGNFLRHSAVIYRADQ